MTTGRFLLSHTLILTLLVCTVKADVEPEKYSSTPLTRVGFYLGITSSHFSIPAAAPWDSRYGPVVGGYAAYGMSELFALQLELTYKSKGALREELYFNQGTEYIPSGDIRLRYVQMSVLARIDPPKGKYDNKSGLRPKLLGGFALGNLVSTKQKGSVAEVDYHFKKTELSLIFGGGFDYRIWGRRSATFDFRFDLGMSYIFSNWKNNTATFIVGVVL